MKYLVMECHLSYAIVLSEDGQFIKVANMGYSVGQTITDIIPMKTLEELEDHGQINPNSSSNTTINRKGSNQTSRKNKLMFKLIATAACFVLIFASVLQFTNNAYASVLLTINPEVRIDVDKNDMVIKVDGMNHDGDIIIQDYIYKGKDLQIVTDELLDKAIEAGYLSDGSTVTLTLDSKDNTWVVDKSDILLNSATNHLSEKISVTITVTGNGIQTNSLETKSSFTTDYNERNDVLEQNRSDYSSTDYDDTDYSDTNHQSIVSSSDYTDNSSNYVNDDIDNNAESANENSSNYNENSSNYDSDAYTSSSDYSVEPNSDNNDGNEYINNSPDNTSGDAQDYSSSNYSSDTSSNSNNSGYSNDDSNNSGNSSYSNDNSSNSSNSMDSNDSDSSGYSSDN